MASALSCCFDWNSTRSPPSTYPLEKNRIFSKPRTWVTLRTRSRTKPTSLQPTTIRAKASVLKEGIVVVGAGIAGLATALSLHRLGLRSLVLEQADSLRTGGTSLTLFKNGWRVLDAIGVGDELRPQFLEIQGL